MGMSVVELGRKFEKEYFALLERLKNIESRIPITTEYDDYSNEVTTLPMFTPRRVGDFAIGINDRVVYVAVGTATADDWEPITSNN